VSDVLRLSRLMGELLGWEIAMIVALAPVHARPAANLPRGRYVDQVVAIRPGA